MVTMQQIADACGVSRGTVDRALHDKEGVRPDVAARIRETAREMGYISARLMPQQTQVWRIGAPLQPAHPLASSPVFPTTCGQIDGEAVMSAGPRDLRTYLG